VIAGTATILQNARVPASSLELVIHGTTLATNALIERKGARTALITTAGFRDSLEIAYEHRFEQYDLYMERPEPLVSRDLRMEVPERLAADGSVLLKLDEAALERLVPLLQQHDIEAAAISFLHSYINPAHEERAREVIARRLPGMALTISSEVCREIREYERTSTAVANAYVLPMMERYLVRMQDGLRRIGVTCPLLMMMSSGGICTVETARRFPVRLIESGPAGGAILARHVAARGGYDRAISFDMGGTTAKLTLIDDFTPQQSRHFEVARTARFAKGSGFPVRIPVIDMVEIGAGGGSIARVDSLRRIAGSHVGAAGCDGDDRLASVDARAGSGARHCRDRRRDHGERDPCACGGERQGHVGPNADRIWWRGAAARRTAGAEAGHSPHRRTRGCRRRFGARLPRRTDCL
jgi:N-methylhydantoinase A